MLDRFMPWKRGKETARATENLQVVLEMTLRCTLFFPRVAQKLSLILPDSAAPARLAAEYGPRMVAATDKLASAISRLGAQPRWYFDCPPDQLEPPNFCRDQVERLEQAVGMMRAVIPLLRDDAAQSELEEVISDFTKLISTLHRIQEEMRIDWQAQTPAP